MHKIMAINAGSSSLKFQIFTMPGEEVLVKGLIERIGLPDAIFNMSFQNEKIKETLAINNHGEAVEILLEQLKAHQVINDLNEITGVGHRVAHGGEDFVTSCVVTDEVVNGIEAVTNLAPLHNPANIIGIKTFRELLPNAVSVAVFDTAFHQTIPEENFLYALPYELYEKHHIRKYGFHGTSHK
ncbi:acetate kinase, partial [Listeria monocytogenes]|nr:acetate kinase [Listeria monocytogenes]